MAGTTRTKSSAWRALFALTTGYFLIMVDQAVVPILTPHLPANVGNSVWITSVYLLCTVVPMLVTGRMGDRFGQRNIYLLGIALYTAGLGVAAVAPGFAFLVVARAVQGFGAAALLPQAFSLIGRVFPADSRGPAFAVWGIVGSVGSLGGPVFAGTLLPVIGWRGVFAIQAAAGVLAIGLAWIWLPRLNPSPAVLDAASVIVSFVGLGAVVYGLQYAQPWSIAIGVVGLVLFAVLQARRGERALLPLQVFSNRNFTFASIAIAAMGIAAAAQFIPLMFWLQSVRGVDALTAGLLTVPMSVVALVLTPWSGKAADTLNPRLLSVAGFAVMAVSMAWSWALMVGESSVYWFAAVTALKGLGAALIWAPNAAVAMRTVPEELAGAASGAYNTVRQVGSVVGVAVIGAVLAAWTPERGMSQSAADSMLVLAVAMLAGLIASLFLRNDLRPDFPVAKR